MKPIFTNRMVRLNEKHKTTNYADRSLKVLDPKIWNSLKQMLNQKLILVNATPDLRFQFKMEMCFKR